MTLKTRSWVKKRIKITWSWKLMFNKAGKRHLLMNKAKSAKTTDKFGSELSASEKKRVLRQLPYGIK